MSVDVIVKPSLEQRGEINDTRWTVAAAAEHSSTLWRTSVRSFKADNENGANEKCKGKIDCTVTG